MNKKYLDVRKTFLDLTQHTTPYSREIEYLKDILPKDLNIDDCGNLYYKIGDNPTVMFTSHMDTVGGNKPIKHRFHNKFVMSDGKSVLGADDKAGVAIMLYMMASGNPGLYYFFIGEEHGCVGSRCLSRALSSNLKDNELYKNIKMVVSLDRRGYNSVITYQANGRCCSDEFAKELSLRLNQHGHMYRPDPTGIYTDSDKLITHFPECTNLSVGYFNEHTNNERQDLDFLKTLSRTLCKIDWNTLPIVRKIVEVDSYSYYHNGGWDW